MRDSDSHAPRAHNAAPYSRTGRTIRLRRDGITPRNGLSSLSTLAPISHKNLREATNFENGRHKRFLAFHPSATRILSPAGAVPTASGCPLAVGRAVLTSGVLRRP